MITLENQWLIQMSLDCVGQAFLVSISRLARRVRKRKLRESKVGQTALQRVFSRLFLRVGCSLFYIASLWSYQGFIFRLFAGEVETIPGVSGNEDESTGVQTDGQLRGRQIVVTRSLVPLAGGPQHDAFEAVHSRGRSRESLERESDDGNISVQMRKLKVLFHVDSKILPHFLNFRSVRHRCCCHCNSCHWSLEGILVSLRW